MNKPLSILALAFMLSACSDGGGSSKKSAPVEEPNPAGVWRGTMTSLLEKERLERCTTAPESAGQNEVFVMVDNFGYARVISTMGIVTVTEDENGTAVECSVSRTEDFLARGRVTDIVTEANKEEMAEDDEDVEVGDFKGYLDVYTVDLKSVDPAANTLQLRNARVTGSFFPQESWSAGLEFDSLELFTFDVGFDQAESLKGASPEALGSLGKLTDASGNEGRALELTFASDGSVQGGDGQCNYSGTFSVPDMSYNIYLFNLAIESVGACNQLRGNYTGMGAIVSENGVTTLKLSLGNAVRNLHYDLMP